MKAYLELALIVFLFLLNMAIFIVPIIMVVSGFNPLWLLIILALCFTIPLTAICICRWLQ